MSPRQEKRVTIAGAVVASLAAIGFGIWLASRKTDPDAAATHPGNAVSTEDRGRAAHEQPTRDKPPSASSQAGTSAMASEGLTATKPGQKSGPEMLEEWLSSSTDPSQVGFAILRGFSQLPPADHAAAAKDLVNLVKDEDFGRLQPLILDAKTSEEAKGILYRDVLIRPVRLRFPALLAIMRQPGNPLAEDAHDALARYLDGDWGTDYEQWQARIDAYLRRMN